MGAGESVGRRTIVVGVDVVGVDVAASASVSALASVHPLAIDARDVQAQRVQHLAIHALPAATAPLLLLKDLARCGVCLCAVAAMRKSSNGSLIEGAIVVRRLQRVGVQGKGNCVPGAPAALPSGYAQTL